MEDIKSSFDNYLKEQDLNPLDELLLDKPEKPRSEERPNQRPHFQQNYRHYNNNNYYQNDFRKYDNFYHRGRGNYNYYHRGRNDNFRQQNYYHKPYQTIEPRNMDNNKMQYTVKKTPTNQALLQK